MPHFTQRPSFTQIYCSCTFFNPHTTNSVQVHLYPTTIPYNTNQSCAPACNFQKLEQDLQTQTMNEQLRRHSDKYVVRLRTVQPKLTFCSLNRYEYCQIKKKLNQSALLL